MVIRRVMWEGTILVVYSGRERKEEEYGVGVTQERQRRSPGNESNEGDGT